MADVTINQARELKRDLEIKVMAMIRTYETRTSLRISAAKMTSITDTRFFHTHVFMPPISRKDTIT